MSIRRCKLLLFAVFAWLPCVSFSSICWADIFVAGDNYETSAGVFYGGTSGSGLGAHVDLGGSGGIFHTTGSRKIDGAGSLGSFSGGSVESWGRSITDTSAFDASNPIAKFNISLRFDIPNSNDTLKGFNIKSSLGGSFGADELISVGMKSSKGNNVLQVTGTEIKDLNFGEDIRGDILDVSVIWNTLSGAYVIDANIRSLATVSVSGVVKNPGTYVPGALGFIHGDVGGGGNDVLFDNLNLAAVPEVSPAIAIPFVLGGAFVASLLTRRRASSGCA